MRSLVKLIGFFVAVEAIGLFGLVFLRLFVSQEVPIWGFLPHPAFSSVENQFTEFDPNLGWYPPAYLFGTPRQELPPKQPGEVRAFLLGGSTVWGVGATREDETIAKRLEFYLNSDQAKALLGGTVHVYNEGVQGYYSKQELILLATKIIPFQQPDLVIVLDGLNDFIVSATDRPQIDRPYSEVWHYKEAQTAQSIRQVMSPAGSIANAVVWAIVGVMRGTFLGNFLDQAVRRGNQKRLGLTARLLLVGKPDPFNPTRAGSQKIANYYLENIAMMRSLCEGMKVRFFWFPQPVLFLKESKTAEEETMDRGNVPLRDSLRKFYETTIWQDAVGRFGGAPFFHDISNSLTRLQGTAYVDPFHYSPSAQDLIARRMAEAILDRQ